MRQRLKNAFAWIVACTVLVTLGVFTAAITAGRGSSSPQQTTGTTETITTGTTTTVTTATTTTGTTATTTTGTTTTTPTKAPKPAGAAKPRRARSRATG